MERVNLELDVNGNTWVVDVSADSIKRWHDMSEVNLDSARSLLTSLCLGLISSYDEELLEEATKSSLQEFIGFASGNNIPTSSLDENMQRILAIYETLYQTLMEHCDQFRVKH